ncbi:hypothetical protein HK102_012115, partial [Quaeritorhiza haematococci]
ASQQRKTHVDSAPQSLQPPTAVTQSPATAHPSPAEIPVSTPTPPPPLPPAAAATPPSSPEQSALSSP